MSDAAAIAARMVDALRVSDPELDTGVGTEPRKIIDLLAEQLAEVDSSKSLLSLRFDIDSKAGADLDEFAAMFGFSRFAARRARGVITLYRHAPAPHPIFVPAGSQVSTASVEPVVFQTVGGAWMSQGATSVQIPIQAVVGGSRGNLGSNEISLLLNGVEDLSSTAANLAATTGGMDEESDARFIERFKRTVFRSLAGTKDMYLGVALESGGPSAGAITPSHANVVDATSTWREQIQIGTDGEAHSSIPTGNIKYVYDDSFLLGTDIAGGSLFARGVHYDVDLSTLPPRIIGHDLEPGAIYDLEFEYTSSASRNDPGAGISNRVDVWVNGEDVVEAGEAFTMTSGRTFTSDTGEPLHNQRFVRLNTANTRPSSGNVFSQLTYGPIHSFPDQFTAAGDEYVRGTHFHIVHDDTAHGWGPTSRFGIEWLGTNRPPDGTQIGVSYWYNKVPRHVEARIRRWRLVGSDARAHQAKHARLVIHLAVMYDVGVSQQRVNQDIFNSISRFMEVQGFATAVQVSDILHAVKSVVGVDAARLLTSQDHSSAYGIHEVTATGILIKNHQEAGRPVDVLLRDDQVPILHDLKISARAQNTINPGGL